MDHHQLSAQLKQLLKRGYSIDDAKQMITAPTTMLEQVVSEYLAEQAIAQRNMVSQQNQANYAMGLRY
ncbi:hypothetical protein [Neptunomonas marina]|uniref:Uncharacterized protein n=1 Tax=Neptunomonas marina TaxID=1815562 RepID=A0A437Q612_9GAMM|nr:hypothetical protein [Neptunomonas marina]RVU29949.1 hypothetical protein EOE65_12845 [Neptunomonas marina]